MLGNPPHEGALRRVNAPSEQAWPTCHNMHKEEMDGQIFDKFAFLY